MAGKPTIRSGPFVALLASFLVYAIPLPGPHAVPLLGTAIVAALSRSGGNALTMPTMVFAVLAQVLTFFVVRWCLGGKRRLLWLLLYAPALVVGTIVATMLLIPRAVLIENDRAEDNLGWPIACSLKDASVHVARSSVGGVLGRSGEVFVRTGPEGSRFGLMQGEDCTVTALIPPPMGTMHGIVFAVPGGITLESTWDVPTQKTLWWRRPSKASEAVALPSLPKGVDGPPILSDDGAWLVVVQRPDTPPASPELALRRFEDEAMRIVSLEPLGRGSFIPMGASLRGGSAGRLESGAIHLSRNDDDFLTMDLDGGVTSQAFKPPGVDASALSFRRVEGGWAAWDAYVEDRPSAITWETTTGRGSHTVPRGRGITSADLDPSGRFIAFSTSAIYNLGGVDDSVIVIATGDGAEVFRHNLPGYTRSDVAFVGAGRLAYTSYDGVSKAEVRVVRAPEYSRYSRLLGALRSGRLDRRMYRELARQHTSRSAWWRCGDGLSPFGSPPSWERTARRARFALRTERRVS